MTMDKNCSYKKKDEKRNIYKKNHINPNVNQSCSLDQNIVPWLWLILYYMQMTWKVKSIKKEKNR